MYIIHISCMHGFSVNVTYILCKQHLTDCQYLSKFKLLS